MAEPIPDKGRVLTAMSAFWFEQLADVVPAPPDLHRRRRPPRRQPATRSWPGGSCCAAGPRCCRSSASSGATSPGRRGRSTAPRAPCTAPRCPRGCSRPSGCPSRCSPRRPRPRSASTTRTSPSTRAVDLVGAELAERARDVSPRALPAGRGVGRGERGSSSPTPSSSWAWSTASWCWPTRCSPRTLAVLAGRGVVARGHAAVVRQAAGAGLPRSPRLGQGARRPRRCPPRWWPPPRARYREAYERITGRQLADWPGA